MILVVFFPHDLANINHRYGFVMGDFLRKFGLSVPVIKALVSRK